jgi:hypothetical protein
MKKFELLGKVLSRQQQKKILGGDLRCDRPQQCVCNNQSFTCCSDHLAACLAAHGCTSYVCVY